MPSVLIVDDSLGFPSLVKTWLQQDGRFEVLGIAATATEGMRLVAAHRPDVIVLDLVLPDSPDPVERVRELRALHPGVRIVLVSSLQAEQLANAGEATGVDAICHKGSNQNELVGTVYAVATAGGSDTQNVLP